MWQEGHGGVGLIVLQSPCSIDECAWCFLGHGTRQMAPGGSAVWTRLSRMTGLPVTLYSDQAQMSGSCSFLSVVKVDRQKQTGSPGTDGPTRHQQTHNGNVPQSPAEGCHTMTEGCSSVPCCRALRKALRVQAVLRSPRSVLAVIWMLCCIFSGRQLGDNYCRAVWVGPLVISS